MLITYDVSLYSYHFYCMYRYTYLPLQPKCKPANVPEAFVQ